MTYKGDLIRFTADLSAETLQAGREWQAIFKVLKGKNLQPRLLHPARISFKIDGEIKHKHTETKNTITEIKNTLEETNSRISETEEQISDLEDKMVEITSEEQNKVKRMKRTADSLRDVWDNIKHTNI